MKRTLASLLALLILFAGPAVVLAAWAATEDFESYANAADMNGKSGGSGWTNNWSTAGSTWIASNGSLYQGSMAARTTTGFMQRQFTAITSGTETVYVALKRTVRGANSSRFYILNTAQTGGIGIAFETTGNIDVQGATVTTVVTNYTADQWYVFRIAVNRDAWTATIDYSTSAYGTAGTWTNAVTNKAMSGSASNLTDIRYECDNLTGGGFWYTDYLSPTTPFTSAVATPPFFRVIWW